MVYSLLLTCEHAGNRVPAAYRHLFRHAQAALDSHRGWDPGALDLARAFEGHFSAPLFHTTVTRLLVEPNRSLGHPRLFSEFTAGVDEPTRRTIIARHYAPHRERIQSWIEQMLAGGRPVLHLGVHTFTPSLNGKPRNTDVGLLYDPTHKSEKQFCDAWRAAVIQSRPDLRVRRNYPYLGKSDGLTTELRRRFGPRRYIGIELEINQLWAQEPAADWRKLQRALIDSFQLVFSRAQ